MAAAKHRWGDRICVIGNIELGHTLTRGTPEEVETEETRRLDASAF